MEDNDTDSLIFEHVDTKQKHDQDILSAEDLAWADSCLIEDPEISETNMDSLKEALLHILDQHSEIHAPTAYEQGFVLSESVTDPPSAEDIFKVWDLDIPVEEEDELDKQLKDALSSDADPIRVPKTQGLKMESLDSLVESIADLSIK